MAVAIENCHPFSFFHPYPVHHEQESVFLEVAWPFSYDDEFELRPAFKSPPLPIFTSQRVKATTIALEARAPAWWESELAPSVHETLKRKEKNLNRIEMKSPQICFRAEVVDFVTAVCRNLDISTGTRHTAVRLLDYFMDGHNVMYYRLRLVALTCLLIAAKFEERDDAIPTVDALQYAAKLVDSTTLFSTDELVVLELYALKYFKWNVSRPSVAHFIDYYQHISLNSPPTPSALMMCDNSDSTAQTMASNMAAAQRAAFEGQVPEFITGFIEAVLREQQFLCHNPSKIAAAIVCVVRICVRMNRVWTPELQSITSYTLEDLQPIVNSLLRLYDEEYS